MKYPSMRFIGKALTDLIFSSGKGLDFSEDSKGVFKGIEAIIYRLNTNITGDDDPIGLTGGEWEIADDTVNENQLGNTGVTESNGIFTFSSTGYWNIRLIASQTDNTNAGNMTLSIQSEIGSGFSVISQAISDIAAVGEWNSATCEVLLKVEDVINTVKFSVDQQYTTGLLRGSSTINTTYAIFIKLADL